MLIDLPRWRAQAARLSECYRSAQPFPHIVLDAFLDPQLACRLQRAFPAPTDSEWIAYKHYNEHKLGNSKREQFPALIGQLVDELNSAAFVSFLSTLTGIPDLRADAMLEGGGMHQTESGGFLNVHADFTMHHYHERWRRRCNVIIYLNEGWQDAWGGALEFWSADMSRCVTKIAPVLNRVLVFNTDETSFHGYPDPIACPAGVTRKSLALYYFTEEHDPAYAAKSTNYRARPTDGAKSILIWADTKALDVYSRFKRRLGFSDQTMSRVLQRLSRRKSP